MRVEFMSSIFYFREFICLALALFCALIETRRTTVKTTEEVISTYESYCGGLKNGSVVSPKKILYYQCMPLIFAVRKAHNLFETEASFISSLLEPPLPEESKLKLKIVLNEVQLLTFHVLDANDLRPDVQLKITTTWQDERLKWDPAVWRFTSYPVELKPLVHIWGPTFNLKGASSISTMVSEVSFHDSKVTYTGNVTVSYSAQLTFAKCTTDLALYPYDFMKCCTELNVMPEDRLTVDLKTTTTSWDLSAPTIWSIKSLDMQPRNKKDSPIANGANLCIMAKRNTVAVSNELSLPMAVSAIVAMCAQLAGKWKMQVYTKLFAIMIQIFAFLNILPNNTLTNVTKLPRIYIFYNFTLATTIFSLFHTMLFWALSRRWFIMPPPHRLTLSMRVVSGILLGNKLDLMTTAVPSTVDGQQLEPKKQDYRKEWETIFGTMHVLLSLLIIFIYAIGIIVIYTSNG